jgi:hypothetical protein
VVFVANADPEFIGLCETDFPKDAVVIDFWRCLKPEVQNSQKIKYVPAGRCINPSFDKVLEGLYA